MAANAIRPFDINSAPHCPGIPASATAYSLNFTVTQTAGPSGDIRVWPTGTPPIVITSVLNWTQVNAVVANATIMPAGTNGSIDVQVAGSNTHLLIDINGYFSHTLGNQTHYLELRNNVAGAPAALFANSSNANMSTGVLGLTGPEFPRPGNYFAAGMRGEGTLTGLLGVSQLQGVAGSLVNGAGGELGFGVLAINYFGKVYGVVGNIYNEDNHAAGVYGIDGGGDPAGVNEHVSAGVRGASVNGYGVLGVSRLFGVKGGFIDAFGIESASGQLGVSEDVGVYSIGDMIATGMKSFVDPHPTDPTKEIVYVALEGPEAGTYFRGRGRFQLGMAVIEIPEDFRMVTDSEGLSIQLTPIGEMATVAVASIALDRIVVKGSRDVEFFYTVNGVRRAFKHHEPIAENTHYVPDRPKARMPGAYAPEQRRRLIATRIYNEDGTVNVETARRLGWDKIWEQRSRPAPEPTP
jgi:hypothetical protein